MNQRWFFLYPPQSYPLEANWHSVQVCKASEGQKKYFAICEIIPIGWALSPPCCEYKVLPVFQEKKNQQLDKKFERTRIKNWQTFLIFFFCNFRCIYFKSSRLLFFHSIRDQLQLLWNMEQNLHVYFFVYCVFAMNSFFVCLLFASFLSLA